MTPTNFVPSESGLAANPSEPPPIGAGVNNRGWFG
jgi:hypothetical protein